jgi:hypothetical protein
MLFLHETDVLVSRISLHWGLNITPCSLVDTVQVPEETYAFILGIDVSRWSRNSQKGGANCWISHHVRMHVHGFMVSVTTVCSATLALTSPVCSATLALTTPIVWRRRWRSRFVTVIRVGYSVNLWSGVSQMRGLWGGQRNRRGMKGKISCFEVLARPDQFCVTAVL